MTKAKQKAGDGSGNPKDACGRAKPNLALLPASALIMGAAVMQHGADKYGAYNWRREQVAATVYVSAMMRHLLAFVDGQDIDEESGLPHLAHVFAGAGILMDAIACEQAVDDRPDIGPAPELIRQYTRPTFEPQCDRPGAVGGTRV